MASEAIKRMVLQQMFVQGEKNRQRKRDEAEYAKIAEMSGGLVGQAPIEQHTTPYQMDPGETFPGEAPIQGLMNDVAAQPGTGLFDADKSPRENFTAYNQRLLASGIDPLQAQGLSGMQSLQNDMTSVTNTRPQVVKYGNKDNPNQQITAMVYPNQLDENGNVRTQVLGGPRNTRNDLLNTGTTWYNPVTKEDIPINNYQKKADEAAGTSSVTQPDKIEMAKINDEMARRLQAIKTDDQAWLELNKGDVGRYNEGAIASEKFKPTMATIKRIGELANSVETGPIAGTPILVWARKAFGNEELQELEALLKGLPLPQLRKIFGAQFTAAEGRTLKDSMASLDKDAGSFKEIMNKMKYDTIYDERVHQSKKRWINNGKRLISWKNQIKRPETSKQAIRIRLWHPSGDAVYIDPVDYKDALAEGYEEL